jgi:hypothetical protein
LVALHPITCWPILQLDDEHMPVQACVLKPAIGVG